MQKESSFSFHFRVHSKFGEAKFTEKGKRPAMGTGTWGMRDKFKFTRKIWKYE